MRKKTILSLVILSSYLLSITACAPYIGAPSMTVLSNDISKNHKNIKILKNVEQETETWTWAFLVFFVGNPMPTHESAISRLLEKHDADLLLNAELSVHQYGIPYLFLLIQTKVKGQPAKFVNGGQR